MGKKIKFEKDGEKYVLEYTREAVQVMEAQGFSLSELTKKMMTMLPIAFRGLFYKNHKNVSGSFIDECYDLFGDKKQLMESIALMLADTYNGLTEENKDETKNIKWEIE